MNFVDNIRLVFYDINIFTQVSIFVNQVLVVNARHMGFVEAKAFLYRRGKTDEKQANN